MSGQEPSDGPVAERQVRPVAPRLRVHREEHEEFVVLRLVGQFVALTALTVQVNLARSLAARPPRIVLETHGVRVMDAVAATMIHAAAQVAGERAGYVRVVAPSAAAVAALRALPPGSVSVHVSVADALLGVSATPAADAQERGAPPRTRGGATSTRARSGDARATVRRTRTGALSTDGEEHGATR
ncbi:STAS domain-containing protein [Dactylosporangium sp. NPDC051484]|uniref:STAS domain-containing protein n=1 Tax=Dactylosporangium sp. NPDC051484 TaxID=3154942 RepID=UPI00344D71BF